MQSGNEYARKMEAVTMRPGPLRRIFGPTLSLFRISAARRSLAREAAAELLMAWALVRLRPFATYSARMGIGVNGDPEWDLDAKPVIAALHDVNWAIRRCNLVAAGRFTCLMQAMAGQRMLARRGVEGAVVLGVKPGRSGADPTAHAWLRVGRFVVLGDEERPGHIPVASYRKAP